MSEIIPFPTADQWPELAGMNKEDLLQALSSVHEKLALLDEQEPEDMTSEVYESWAEQHEDLEDLADEIQDRLEEM